MRKILAVFILGLNLIGSSFAETVYYKVKYQNEQSETKAITYQVDTELGELPNTAKSVFHIWFKFNEILGEDSDAEDWAIVNKLDRQGYSYARTSEYGYLTDYAKINGIWYKYYGYRGDK